MCILPAILKSYASIDMLIFKLGTYYLKARFSVTPKNIAQYCERLIKMIHLDTKNAIRGMFKIFLLCPPPMLELGCLGAMFLGGAQKFQNLAQAYAQTAKRAVFWFFDAGQVTLADDIAGVHYSAESRSVVGSESSFLFSPSSQTT
ncbi:MAG: hypothetical protein ACI9O0_001043 [Paracoccaceae bacterium]